jgi:ribonuclease R
MLAANVCAADFIAERGHPALYRVHEGPTPEKRTTLQNYLRALGLGFSVSDDPSPGELQAISEATRERPDVAQIHSMLLRSMQQAIYTPSNSGHFGLAYGAYAHFTSPIRRYPDLLVHRVIKSLLTHKHYRLVTPDMAAPARARIGVMPTKSAKPLSQEQEQWELAGQHCSANERRADEASRDVEAWLKCRFMREHLGEEYAGTVSSVANFGLFVTLDALYVDGMVHITELGGEYFRFDEVRQELRGERSGVRYAVGSRVRVQVSRVDLDSRKIDFRLVHEIDEERLLARGRAPKATGIASEDLAEIKAADRALKARSGTAGKRAKTGAAAATKSPRARRAAGSNGTKTSAKGKPYR